MIKCFAG